jgi:hypothetical protein
MSMAQREKKDEDEAYSPFAGLQKAAVLQETRCFNDREINPRKCIGILTRILWLLTQGDKLSRLETTEVFFGVTKLLQAKDQQMVRRQRLPSARPRLRLPPPPPQPALSTPIAPAALAAAAMAASAASARRGRRGRRPAWRRRPPPRCRPAVDACVRMVAVGMPPSVGCAASRMTTPPCVPCVCAAPATLSDAKGAQAQP